MPESTEDFDQLRRLLKLKRHEQAPPGYFDRLPDRIVARIERGRSYEGMSWMERLRVVLSENPITSGIFAICGILMVVLANSEYLDGYAAGPVQPVMGVPAMQLGSVDQPANEPEVLRTSGLKVASLSETVPGVYPAVPLGPIGSSLSALTVNAQQVSCNFSH